MDPDYGVILPFDIPYACNNKDLLEEYYKNMKLEMSSRQDTLKKVKKVADIYHANKGRDFEYKEGIDGYFGKGYKNCEERYYLYKWLIPGIMILFSVFAYIFISNINRKKKS